MSIPPGPTGVGSIRVKVLILAMSLVLFPAFGFGWIASSRSRASLEHVIGVHLSREARQTADRLEAAVAAELSALRGMANQDVMRDVRVADIDRRVAGALAKLEDASPSRLGAVVLDPTGRLVAASAPEWFDESRAAVVGVARELASDPATRGRVRCPGVARPCIVMVTPIPNPDRATGSIGLLAGVYDWTALASVTAMVEAELAAIGLRSRVEVLVDPLPGAGDGAIRREPSVGLSGLAPGVTDYVVDDEGGWLLGRAGLDGEPSRGVVVAVALPDALGPVREMAHALLVAGLIALAVAAAGAVIGSTKLVQPLVELTRAIRELARTGSSGSKVPVRSRDELGQLAGAFNQMAGDLDRARDELVEAAKLSIVGRVAAGVAHEVRTSLGVLRSSSQVLERSTALKEDARAAELVHMGRIEIDRLARVVNDLLNLARPRELHLQEVDLRIPVFRAADFVEAQAGARRVEIHRTVTGPDTVTRCDPELIYQVALNLLVNALQVNEGPRGTIEVRIFRNDAGVGFEVEDDGPGVPEELRASLFEPFVTEREGGVGLGLAFVKRVVQQHRGDIEVTGAPGKGACFRVLLPGREESA